MEIASFKDLRVTTMTLIAPFKGKICIDSTFALLPVTKIDLPRKKRSTKKIKIPHCGIPGAIVSMRFKGCTRGIFRSASRRHFRNSITMDISTQEKNISLKLSKNSIHMCGPTSLAMGQEAIDYLFGYIEEIQQELQYMNRDPDKKQQTLEWLMTSTRGEAIDRVQKYILPSENISLAVTQTFQDHQVVIPTLDTAPAKVDVRLARFLLRHAHEFLYHSELMMEFEHISHLEGIVEESIQMERIFKAMVNYNYHLGFNVNRQRLKDVFDAVGGGWCVRYDPLIDHTVTIQIPYQVPPEAEFMRKPDKVHCHTFMVQKSGVVTQSGPDETIMKPAYYVFMNIIQTYYGYILKTDDL
jgi:hypothetical protein